MKVCTTQNRFNESEKNETTEKDQNSLSNRQHPEFIPERLDANLFGRIQPQMTKTGNRVKDYRFIDQRDQPQERVISFAVSRDDEIAKTFHCVTGAFK